MKDIKEISEITALGDSNKVYALIDNQFVLVDKETLVGGSGIIAITEEEFLAHEEEYRASGKTYMITTDGDLSKASGVALDTISGMSATTVQGGIEEIYSDLADFSSYGKNLKYTDYQIYPSTEVASGGVISGSFELPDGVNTILAATIYTQGQNDFVCSMNYANKQYWFTIKNVYSSALTTTVRIKLLYI